MSSNVSRVLHVPKHRESNLGRAMACTKDTGLLLVLETKRCFHPFIFLTRYKYLHLFAADFWFLILKRGRAAKLEGSLYTVCSVQTRLQYTRMSALQLCASKDADPHLGHCSRFSEVTTQWRTISFQIAHHCYLLLWNLATGRRSLKRLSLAAHRSLVILQSVIPQLHGNWRNFTVLRGQWGRA